MALFCVQDGSSSVAVVWSIVSSHQQVSLVILHRSDGFFILMADQFCSEASDDPSSVVGRRGGYHLNSFSGLGLDSWPSLTS